MSRTLSRAASAFGAKTAVRVTSETPPTNTSFARPKRFLSSAIPSFLLLFFALALTSCGGAGGAGGAAQSAGSPEEYASQASRDSGVAAASGAIGEGEASAAGAAASSSAAEIRAEDGLALPGFDGEKIIKTAELGLRSEDVREGASRAREVAARFGGSVTSSRIDGGDEYVSADLVLSVPSPEFEAALDDLRDLGDVTTDTVGGEDVTEEFVDLESRRRNLLAAEESLLRLYEKAESVDDTLSIERELTELRGQIEGVQGRLQYLEDRTVTSRIALAIQPVEEIVARSAWEPARAVSTAWNASLNFLGTAAGAVISVVVFGWWLAPAFVAAGVWWTRRSRHPGTTRSP